MEQESSKPLPTEEELLQYLFKIDGLIELLLTQDLAVLPPSKLYNCLLTMKNLAAKAVEINEKLLPPPAIELPPLGEISNFPQPPFVHSCLQEERNIDNLTERTKISYKSSARQNNLK